MIVGIGTDLVHIPRIAEMHKRWGARFVHRIFCDEEAEYCLSYREPAHFLATRFAAKEACSKALGTGMGKGVSWRQICVIHDKNNRPILRLSGKALCRARDIGAQRWHVSLTHEHEYAHAIVILED